MIVVGIDLRVDKTQVCFFDKASTQPKLAATLSGYGTFSEGKITEIFYELKQKTSATEAVIAVSAGFSIIQRRAVKSLCERAGIKVLRIIQKSSAAALAYEFGRSQEKKQKEINIALCTVEKNKFEIAFVSTGDGVAEVQAIEWEESFDNIDILRFKEVFTNIAAERERQMISSANAEGKIAAKIKFLPEQIDSVLINGNPEYFPLMELLVKDFFGKAPEVCSDPDEYAAIGASIQSAILKGHVKGVLLLDIIPDSLSVEICDNAAELFIMRNTTFPVKKSKVYSVFMSKSGSIDINIFCGNHKIVTRNELIGKFKIPNIPHGGSEIEIEMSIDTNGIILVNAECLANKSKNTITI